MKTKTDGLSALKQAIKAGDPARLYVFYGEESYLRQHYLAQLKQCLVPPGLESFNYESLEARGLTPERLQDAVEGLPAFAPRKMVVVKDVDIYKPGEALKPVVEMLLDNLPESVCLVFVYDTVSFKADARTKIHALITKAGQLVEFSPQQAHDLIPWITRHFAAQGRQIDRGLCEYLIFQCGDLMTGLKSEIDKVAAYAKQDRVTREDIDAVVTPILDAVVYQMTDAIAARDWAKAMEVLMELRQMREEPVVLLAALGRSLRGLYVARLAHTAHRDARAVMQVMGYRSSYPAERLMHAARGRSLAWCRRAVSLCAQVDYTLKSSGGRGDRGRSLEWIVACLAEEGGS